ncbi:MAG: polyprenyl synthetase family protein [Myxococcales bacterium]|nr:polyprenyl synthetase family protein [Myxococcales bacterium]
MASPNFLLDYARRSEPRLRNFLDAKTAEIGKLPVDLKPAFAQLRDYVLRGGKRLRGALVEQGFRTAGDDPAPALDPSIGIELLHAYLLIHDDFMDRDEVRRGGPTIHAALGGDHLAGSVAILLGSLCQAWAWELVLAAPVGPERALKAAQMLGKSLQDVTIGQTLDLLATKVVALDARGVLEVQRLKTGSYTFELPLHLGALLAGASQEKVDALTRYARPLGQAFQIADDLLGTFGAPEVTGKPNASDLREGKRTLLVARALETATAADAEMLRVGLGRAGADVEALRDILRRSGAVDSARAEAERLRDEALRALENAPFPATVAESLRELAIYTVDRAA